MRRSNMVFVTSLVILVVGAAILVYGIITYNNLSASLGSKVEKLFTGKSQAVDQSVVLMIVGAAAAVIGLVLIYARGRGGRRR